MDTNLFGKNVVNLDMTCGIGTYGCSRGAFKTEKQTIPNINAQGIYRGDTIDSDSGAAYAFKTSDLLLMSFMAQYKQSRFTLGGVLDGVNYGLTLRRKLIKDTAHMASRAFYIVNGTWKDREETMSVEMIELTSVRENSVTWQ